MSAQTMKLIGVIALGLVVTGCTSTGANGGRGQMTGKMSMQGCQMGMASAGTSAESSHRDGSAKGAMAMKDCAMMGGRGGTEAPPNAEDHAKHHAQP